MGLLTPKQRQVLELYSRGLDHRQVAARMGIGRQSVRKHVVNICDKAFTKRGMRHLKAFILWKLAEDEL